jgi:hypothetical protein
MTFYKEEKQMLCVENIWQLHATCENLLALKILHDHGIDVSTMRYGVYSDQDWEAGEDIVYEVIELFFGSWVDTREEETAYEVQKIAVDCRDIQQLYENMDEPFLQKQFESYSHTESERYPAEMFIHLTETGFAMEFHELSGFCCTEFIETFIGIRKKIDQLMTFLDDQPKEDNTNATLPCAV